MIKLIDLLENKMTPAQKKKRGEIFDKLKASGMSDAKAGAIATSKAMSEKLDPVGKEDDDINNDGKVDKTDKYLASRRKAISANIKEGEDHEVAMAIASLKSIMSSTSQLMQKLGSEERNIPGWIQDHIAKAENYIEQAAQGFHELKDEELDEAAKVRQEPVGGRRVELIISSKDKAEVEKEIENIENKYPSAGYGTMVKKEPYQKGDTWIAVVRRGTTSD